MSGARVSYEGAESFLPSPRGNLKALREASRTCRGCDLFARATQTVFGAGNPNARMVLVGEEPGDKEDLAGAPFVGPAGHVLDDALARSGIDHAEVYLTNAVKHFKWEPRGKIRLHKKPTAREVVACVPWLEAELAAIKPAVIVGLGATAARSILGRPVTLSSQRGKTIERQDGYPVILTLHPSAVLRATPEAREEARGRLVDDLRRAARIAGKA